jgi:hypothetical protein
MMKTNVLCVYHRDCADGFAAAWAVHRRFGAAVDFVAAKYGDPPPKCAGRDVLVVDFSYPREVLEAMAQEARSVLVLDHHKTAAEQLAGLPSAEGLADQWLGSIKNWKGAAPTANGGKTNLATVFDMNRSGAGITWDYLHPGVPRPCLIDLVEDRDLWRFKHDPETRRFHAVAASYGYSLTEETCGLENALRLWDQWNRTSQHSGNASMVWQSTLAEGGAILRAQDQLVDGIISGTRRTMRIAGHAVPVACCPGALASEAGNRLCNPPLPDHLPATGVMLGDPNRPPAEWLAQYMPPFTATYYDGADGRRHFSLRSPPSGADVGAIAAGYGGGGHHHAAGFDQAIGWEGE